MQEYLIAPSILSADFARLGDDINNVLSAGADIVHFDVMDNHYVDNLTIGPMVCTALRDFGINAPIDVHLMVQPVDRMIQAFAVAGADYITFHPEASAHVDRSLQLIKEAGCKSGLVLNPATPLSFLEHTLHQVDMVLLMSVNPGFGGQVFIERTLDKIYAVRQLIDQTGQDIRLEVDGGINSSNIARIAEAGADTFVAGSASVQGGEKWGQYSIVGLHAHTVLRVYGRKILVSVDGAITEQYESADPLTFVERFKQRYNVADIKGLSRFNGGLVGYFGYDTVRYIEPRLSNGVNSDPLGTPDILLMVSDAVVVFDNLADTLNIIVLADPEEENSYEQAQIQMQRIIKLLNKPIMPRKGVNLSRNVVRDDSFQSSFTQSDYEQSVEAIKQYIAAGDCMQVVLSQRISIPFASSPIDLYRALRCTNPTPYMYFFNFGDFHVVGSSPEVLVRVEDNIVTARPIAGTRPRGATEEQDKALESDLLADSKEIAEHLMLIDLARNDVGRVSEIGCVELTDKMIVERYSNVMHIVSNVTGRLRSDLQSMDALRSILPAGTLSGAPKIRAMEIIDEQESVKRGIYGGAVGYWAWNGNMDTAIAIRTAVIKEGTLHMQAGAGIVADSVPVSEWNETLNKSRAMLQAVDLLE
ncbi:UNVERIFIED_CONTAM: hypothetical protein GTU68_036758 [Idotea baltica]|nr:hypothetical protein [Idotea baltica]